jgi:hypothetical protein
MFYKNIVINMNVYIIFITLLNNIFMNMNAHMVLIMFLMKLIIGF